MTRETNEWHPLPMLIGSAIVNQDGGPYRCGGFVVTNLDGTLLIEEVIDADVDRQELYRRHRHETTKVRIALDDLSDMYEARFILGQIALPEEGWETSTVSAEHFEGYR